MCRRGQTALMFLVLGKQRDEQQEEGKRGKVRADSAEEKLRRALWVWTAWPGGGWSGRQVL